jgi:hypothetical protein
MIALVHHEMPSKTYATPENAMAAFFKACNARGITDMRFVVASGRLFPNEPVRFFPVSLPSADQIQAGIALARLGFFSVRT